MGEGRSLSTPFVPVPGDPPEDLADLFARVAAAGADYVLFGGGMILRARQALWFRDRLPRPAPHRPVDPGPPGQANLFD